MVCNTFMMRNNFFIPGGCMPFSQPMFMQPRMFMPMGPSMFMGGGFGFYGGGCNNWNRAGDYITSMMMLNSFGNLMNNSIMPMFNNNSSNRTTQFTANDEVVTTTPTRRRAARTVEVEGNARTEASSVRRKSSEPREIKYLPDEAISDLEYEPAEYEPKGFKKFLSRLFPKTGLRDVAKHELGKEFIKETKQIAKKLHCKTNDLLAIMNSESGLDPQAVNRSSGASGLIQIMPANFEALGITKEEFRQMDALEQLPYVEKFLTGAKKMAGFKPNQRLDSGDLYALLLAPAYASREVLYDSELHSKEYNGNTGLDLNKDGLITKSELKTHVKRKAQDLFA